MAKRNNRRGRVSMVLVAMVVVWAAILCAGLWAASQRETLSEKLWAGTLILAVFVGCPLVVWVLLRHGAKSAAEIPPIVIEPDPPLTAVQDASARAVEKRIQQLLTAKGVEWKFTGHGGLPEIAAMRVYEWQGTLTLSEDELAELRAICPLLVWTGVQLQARGSFEFYEYSPVYAR